MGDNQPCICLQGSMIGREEQNRPQGSGINEDVSFTLNTTDRPAVVAFTQNQREEVRDLGDKAGALAAEPGVHQQTYVFGICSDGSNSMKSSNPNSGVYEAKTSRTLDMNGGSPACNQGGMAIVQTWSPKMWHGEENKASPLLSTDYKDPQCVVQTYQNTTGPLMANSHPGSYSGQDAYTDMFVTQPATYSLDRASFNQGENALYDFQITDDDKTQTVISRGPNAVETSQCNYSVRRLTPLECERLQGFPDNWTNITKASDSGRYKGLGNSVAKPCVDYVMEGIQIILDKEVSQC